MIDTVVITLDWRKDFEITESCYGNFSPDVTNYFVPPYVKFGKIKAIKATCNPTPSDKKNGVYLPRMTLIKAIRNGSVPITLNVEFSAPKVIFGNNFDEIEEYDLGYLCEQLKRRLTQKGIFVPSAQALMNARVSTIHYAKNIILTDYSTAHAIVADLSRCNYTTQKQIDGQKYRNNGEALHYYSKNWGLCIYDKVKEHNKAKVSEKGLLEKDGYCQLSLFDDDPYINPFEVVRVEARYIGRPQIKKSLLAAGVSVEGEMTLAELFKKEIAKKMLCYEMAKLRKSYPKIALSDKKAPALLSELCVNNPHAQISTIMNAVAYKALVEATGCRDIRQMGNFSSQQWRNFHYKVNKLDFSTRAHNGFDTIENQINEFKSVKLKRYLAK